MQNHKNELQRSMKSRHLFIIALGGVIGTGLFLGSGFTISQAGPLGAIAAYIIGGFLMYLVMLCLGELAVAMPVAGSFQPTPLNFWDRRQVYDWLAVLVQLGEYSGVRADVSRHFDAKVAALRSNLDMVPRVRHRYLFD